MSKSKVCSGYRLELSDRIAQTVHNLPVQLIAHCQGLATDIRDKMLSGIEIRLAEFDNFDRELNLLFWQTKIARWFSDDSIYTRRIIRNQSIEYIEAYHTWTELVPKQSLAEEFQWSKRQVQLVVKQRINCITNSGFNHILLILFHLLD